MTTNDPVEPDEPAKPDSESVPDAEPIPAPVPPGPAPTEPIPAPVPPGPAPTEPAPAAVPPAAAPTEPAPAAAAAQQARPASGTGPLRVLSIIVIVAGGILMIAGVITWFIVRDELSDEKIVVSDDAPFLGGWEVDGPFTAYAEAEAIEDHALEASGGFTYAQLDREDPTRETVMTASFLRASLFTSVVAFGVAFFAFGLGIVLILIGWALLRVARALRWSRPAEPLAVG